MAVDDQYIYWGDSDTGSIGRANLPNAPDGDPTNVTQSFIGDVGAYSGVTVDDQYIYWADSGNFGNVARADLNGAPSSVNRFFVNGRPGATIQADALAVDDQYIYWAADERRLHRARQSRRRLGRRGACTGSSDPGAVAVDDANVYWAHLFGPAIGRADLGGDPNSVNQSFISAPGGPSGVAVDALTGSCAGSTATIVGTGRPDKLRGTNGDDVIAAGGGNDKVLGRKGDDLVCGAAGADVLRGKGGGDVLRGGAGDDVLQGGAGTTSCTARAATTSSAAGTETTCNGAAAARTNVAVGAARTEGTAAKRCPPRRQSPDPRSTLRPPRRARPRRPRPRDPHARVPRDAFVYWADNDTSTIGRVNLDGTGVDQNFIPAIGGPLTVAVDADYVYWNNINDETQQTNTVGRANLDGTGVEQNFITGTWRCDGVGRRRPIRLLVVGPRDRARQPRRRTNVNQEFIGTHGPAIPAGMAVGGGYIYWTNEGRPTFLARSGAPTWTVAASKQLQSTRAQRSPRTPLGGRSTFSTSTGRIPSGSLQHHRARGCVARQRGVPRRDSTSATSTQNPQFARLVNKPPGWRSAAAISTGRTMAGLPE